MRKYTLSFDSFGDKEKNAAMDIINSGCYTMGSKVKEFEEHLTRWLGVKHAVMVNSGSSANLLAIDSLLRRSQTKDIKLRMGDEIIVPALAWPTTIWPIIQLGLKPVFSDICPDSMAIDLNSAGRLVTENTKAMFLIHVLGQACDMNKYTKFCDDNNLVLIEDCCESLGSFSHRETVGSFGLCGTLSFYFSHHITTIEGGAILTNDDNLFEDLKSMRSHGWLRDRNDKDNWTNRYPDLDPRFLFIMPGYNVRPMEIQGALGIEQIKYLDEFLKKREQIVIKFNEILNSVNWIKIIGESFIGKIFDDRTKRAHSWMNIPMLIAEDAPLNVNRVKGIFEDSGIETRPIIASNILKHPAMESVEYRADDFPVCNSISMSGFMVGCHPHIGNNEYSCLEKACQILGKF